MIINQIMLTMPSRWRWRALVLGLLLEVEVTLCLYLSVCVSLSLYGAARRPRLTFRARCELRAGGHAAIPLD